jgi:hypothetical protein
MMSRFLPAEIFLHSVSLCSLPQVSGEGACKAAMPFYIVDLSGGIVK